MARTRKEFLAAASAVGAGLAITGQAQAQTPSPSPKATAAASSFARDFAEHMRSFDPHLSGKQVDDIAHQIDELYGLRKALRPKGHGLSNGDAPSPQFEVSE
jgi:hypothetical protein